MYMLLVIRSTVLRAGKERGRDKDKEVNCLKPVIVWDLSSEREFENLGCHTQ